MPARIEKRTQGAWGFTVQQVAEFDTAAEAARFLDAANDRTLRMTVDTVNQPGVPHEATCEQCGHAAGEHIRRSIYDRERGYRCPTEREVQASHAAELQDEDPEPFCEMTGPAGGAPHARGSGPSKGDRTCH